MPEAQAEPVSPDAPIAENLPPKTHNQDAFNIDKERADELVKNCNLWMNEVKEISDDAQAGRAADFKKQLRAAKTQAEKDRVETNEPLNMELKANSARYNGLKSFLEVSMSKIDELLLPHLKRKEAAKFEAEKQAKIEVQSKEREAAALIEAAKESDGDVVETGVAAIEAVSEAEKAAAALKKLQNSKTQVKGTQSDKATGLRTTYFAVVINIDEAFNYYKDEHKSEIIKMLEKFASQDARGGRRRIPGFDIQSQQKVS